MKIIQSIVVPMAFLWVLAGCRGGELSNINPDLSEDLSDVHDVVSPELQALNCSRFSSLLEKVNEAKQLFSACSGAKDGCWEPVLGTAPSSAPSSEANDRPAGSSIPKVGEPDFVKADGDHLFVVRSDPLRALEGTLSVFQVSDSGVLTLVDKLPLTGNPVEFLLNQGKIIVMSHGRETQNSPYGMLIHVVDAKDPSKLKLQQTLFLDKSSYVTSRLIGHSVHLVAQVSVNAYEEKEVTEKMIFPAYSFHAGENSNPSEGRLGTCGTTFIPDAVMNSVSSEVAYRDPLSYGSVISLVSIPLDQVQLVPSTITVMGGWSKPVVSANEQSLYVGTGGSGDEENTQIFKFLLPQKDGRAMYAAKGEVPGRLQTAYGWDNYNNQFSMDEHKGSLRVVTTAGKRSGVESSLFVLKQEKDTLKIVGKLVDLHSDEAVYAVRFLGDRGYVVTFKKVDPLFALDLSDAEHPQLLGQLEVPGFSTYMTPIDEKTLLTIGKDADDQGTFAWFGGLKLSLFDVEDIKNPRLIDSVTIGERGTDSEALTNHRAFNFFKEKSLLAIPVDLVTEAPKDANGWRSAGSVDHSEEQLWKVDRKNGFKLAGAVRHDDLKKKDSENHKGCARVDDVVRLRRALKMGEHVITLSDAGIKVNDLDNPAAEISKFVYEDDLMTPALSIAAGCVMP